MNKKIGGCIVLYNPDMRVLDNIATYKNHIELLLIIDNSPQQNLALINKLGTLHSETIYKWMGENKGMARALNTACEIAIQNNCGWLLTMDQDSKFKETEFLQLANSVKDIVSLYSKTGIISPYHHIHDQIDSRKDVDFQPIRSAMTSGNLLNLEVFTAVSGFEEKLFIDFVDHEYCLRLRKKGFMVIQNNKITLEHALGKFEMKTIFGKKIGISNHNQTRRYYITRNGLYTVKKYLFFDLLFCNSIIMSIISDSVRILLFEKQKVSKFRAIGLGIWHSIINRYGKISTLK
jgi:rhamnosyltransferase